MNSVYRLFLKFIIKPRITPCPQQGFLGTAEKVDVVDVDKRTFLKLIGATGLSFFLFSLLGRRTETLLFGESIDSRLSVIENSLTGNTYGTTQNQGYRISEVANDEAATHYGFLNDKGEWFIMREDIETGSFRYARGASHFPESWSRRKNLAYDYYHNIFKQSN